MDGGRTRSPIWQPAHEYDLVDVRNECFIRALLPAANTDITAGPSKPFVAYQAPCPHWTNDLQGPAPRAIRAVGLGRGNLASSGEPADWKWGLKTRR
jgi:hypothetical protein